MNINRHNYEGFFLMYVDNELSDTEKKEVLVFIETNTDLREEFQLLQQAVLKSSEIVFKDKTSLLKKEVSVETQENLLLLLDNEVENEERGRINNLIIADASLANEWSLLQQTKLQPDTTIAFYDKNSLYRTSNKRVIGFNWIRIAAAVLIGFGIWLTVPFLTKKNKVPDNTTVSNNNVKTDTKITPSKQSSEEQAVGKSPLKVVGIVKAQQQTFAQQTAEKHNHKIDRQGASQQNNVIAVTKNNDERNTETNNLPQPYFDTTSNKNIVSNVPLKKLSNEVISSQKDMAVNNNKPEEKLNSITPANIYASNLSLKENTDDSNDDNHILYIPQNKLQKTRIGGLFSKIKKAAKSGIRIANIEIAIK